MESSDLFKQLGLGDPDMEKAREWVSYKKFENSVPDILTLSEFIDTVFKKAYSDNVKPHLWFSERYMISHYIANSDSASDEYVDNMVSKLELIRQRIPSDNEFQHLHLFLNKLNEYICTTRTLIPKNVLTYLNTLYKTKGIK